MKIWIILRPIHRINLATRRLRGDVLAGPLSQAGDYQIDAALKQDGITRTDLFSPSRAIARHRTRLAWMLALWGIDVPRATREHWQELKVADEQCNHCPNTGRCTRWLEWGQFNAAPMVFCPNAELWSAIALEQAATCEDTSPSDQAFQSRDLSESVARIPAQSRGGPGGENDLHPQKSYLREPPSSKRSRRRKPPLFVEISP